MRSGPRDARRRIVWTAAFGLAFGLVEAAVVIYLRRLVYPDGFALPLRTIPTDLLAVELGREAATLAMLAAVGALAGRSGWGRFACFALAFGVWDLTYYAGLKLALGWPPSLATWDILFLIPWPWLGPVYAPAAVAALMIVFGAWTLRLEGSGHRLRADRSTWLLAAGGAAALLWTWLRDAEAAFHGAMPRPYPVAAFVAGVVLLLAAGVRFVRAARPRAPQDPTLAGDLADRTP